MPTEGLKAEKHICCNAAMAPKAIRKLLRNIGAVTRIGLSGPRTIGSGKWRGIAGLEAAADIQAKRLSEALRHRNVGPRLWVLSRPMYRSYLPASPYGSIDFALLAMLRVVTPFV